MNPENQITTYDNKTGELYAVFKNTYSILGLVQALICLPGCLIAFINVNSKLAVVSVSVLLGLLLKIIVFLPIIIGLAVYFISRSSFSKRNYIIHAIAWLILIGIASLQVISSTDGSAFLRVIFLFTFVISVPLIILNRVNDSLFLKIFSWLTLIALILLMLSSFGGEILFYSIFMIFSNLETTAFIFVISIFVLFFSIIAINSRLKLDPMLDYSIYTFASIIIVLSLTLTILLVDLMDIMKFDNVVLTIFIYTYFISAYFIFVCSSIEIFITHYRKTIRPFARPIQELDPAIFPKNEQTYSATWDDSQKNKTQELSHNKIDNQT